MVGLPEQLRIINKKYFHTNLFSKTGDDRFKKRSVNGGIP